MRAIASLVAAFSAVTLSLAQTGSVVINVGGPPTSPYMYSPSSVSAPNGTVVTFVWTGSPGNHTVTQTSATDPCQPLASGFDSGFIFIPTGNTAGSPSWNLTIEDDSKPIYFYCGQLVPIPHCSAGMVGAINAPANGTGSFATYQAAAMATNGTLPGTPVPNLNGVGANATVVAGPFTGSITGFALPSGPTASSAVLITPSSSANGSSSASSGASGSSSGSGSPSPSPTNSGAGIISANILAVFSALVFGLAVL